MKATPSSRATTTARFRLEDEDDEDDDVTFVRADDDGDCPEGYDNSRVDEAICVRD